MEGKRARASGFTLIEILIVLAIMAMVVGAVYTLFSSSQKTYTNQDQIVQLQQNLRSALEMMSQELRSAGHAPMIYKIYTLPPGIGTAERSKIQFSADLNGDGNVNGPNEQITYELQLPDGATVWQLVRTVGGKPDVIAENIVDFQIWYFVVADGSYRGVTPKNDPASTSYKTQDPLNALTGGTNDQDKRDAIRLVRLMVTGRTPYPDPNYVNPDPNYGENNHYRTNTMTVDVAMRNLSYKWGG